MDENLNLGEFSFAVLIAVRNEGRDAYGVPVRHRLESLLRKHVSVGALYTTLERLTEKGFLRSWEGDPTPERGGRAKRFFELTALGENAMAGKAADYKRLASGLTALRPGWSNP